MNACFVNASRSHLLWDITPPIFPNDPPQSATMYHSLTVWPSDSYIPRTLLLVFLASQLFTKAFRMASPDSSLVPRNGLESQVQKMPRLATSSGLFSNIPLVNCPP